MKFQGKMSLKDSSRLYINKRKIERYMVLFIWILKLIWRRLEICAMIERGSLQNWPTCTHALVESAWRLRVGHASVVVCTDIWRARWHGQVVGSTNTWSRQTTVPSQSISLLIFCPGQRVLLLCSWQYYQSVGLEGWYMPWYHVGRGVESIVTLRGS